MSTLPGNQATRKKRADASLQKKWLGFSDVQKGRYIRFAEKQKSKEQEYDVVKKQTAKRSKPLTQSVEKKVSGSKTNKKQKTK